MPTKGKKKQQPSRPKPKRMQPKVTKTNTIAIAPAALDMPRPRVYTKQAPLKHKGSESRVTGVDYIGNIGSSSSIFTITPYILNPRAAGTFPRLSAISAVWRRYYFHRLRFHVVGLSGSGQSGYHACGSLVSDDLADNVNLLTEAQILNLDNVSNGRPWSVAVHDVPLSAGGLKWYSCDPAASTGAYGEYVGVTYLGLPVTANAGDIIVQLYVEYDVEFCQRIAAGLISAVPVFGGLLRSGTGMTTSNLLGTTAFLDTQARGFFVDSSGVITINGVADRTIQLTLTVTGTGLAGPLPTPSGWTLVSALVTSTAAIVIMTRFVGDNNTVGPFTITTATTILQSWVTLSEVPQGSLSALPPEKACPCKA